MVRKILFSRIMDGDCNDGRRRRGTCSTTPPSTSALDQDAARSFYSKALEPLGYSLAFEQGEFMGFARLRR